VLRIVKIFQACKARYVDQPGDGLAGSANPGPRNVALDRRHIAVHDEEREQWLDARDRRAESSAALVDESSTGADTPWHAIPMGANQLQFNIESAADR